MIHARFSAARELLQNPIESGTGVQVWKSDEKCTESKKTKKHQTLCFSIVRGDFFLYCQCCSDHKHFRNTSRFWRPTEYWLSVPKVPIPPPTWFLDAEALCSCAVFTKTEYVFFFSICIRSPQCGTFTEFAFDTAKRGRGAIHQYISYVPRVAANHEN